MQTWKLTLCYDGTDFHGWQVQPGLRTIQGELARVLREVTGAALLPQGSGRTDTGVHAAGQVASFVLDAPIPADRLLRALNRRLPAAIRVLAAQVVDETFHARAHVRQKTYEYRIFPRRIAAGEERICLPAVARYAWDCRWPLALETMQQAAALLAGTHDFTSFAATDPDRSARMAQAEEDRTGDTTPPGNVRTIFSSTWDAAGDLLLYRVSGSGFLHHMVRNLVGTLVEIGAGRRTVDSLRATLAARDRSSAGPTAPPQGLSLVHVEYGEPESSSANTRQHVHAGAA